MKTDLTTLGSYNQSRALFKKDASKDALKAADLKTQAGPSKPDYTVDLSGVKRPDSPSLSSPLELSLPDLPSPPSSSVKETPLKVHDVIKEEAKDEIKKEMKSHEVSSTKEGTLKKPAIFFVKGLDIFSSPSTSETGYAGVGKIAESIEGSRLYGHDQKDEMMKEIKKVHRDYPIILVGHSFGGDTAVEIANDLDSLEHKFRPVDLLITMDAIGFNNDIIPQNVKKHLNIFGEKSWPLNDGPHVARRSDVTSVKNILSPLDHTDLDDDKELQFEIVKIIQETLATKPS